MLNINNFDTVLKDGISLLPTDLIEGGYNRLVLFVQKFGRIESDVMNDTLKILETYCIQNNLLAQVQKEPEAQFKQTFQDPAAYIDDLKNIEFAAKDEKHAKVISNIRENFGCNISTLEITNDIRRFLSESTDLGESTVRYIILELKAFDQAKQKCIKMLEALI